MPKRRKTRTASTNVKRIGNLLQIELTEEDHHMTVGEALRKKGLDLPEDSLFAGRKIEAGTKIGDLREDARGCIIDSKDGRPYKISEMPASFDSLTVKQLFDVKEFFAAKQ